MAGYQTVAQRNLTCAIRIREHTDYHLSTPAGPLLIREAGPPRADPGPARWSLLRLRLLPPD